MKLFLHAHATHPDWHFAFALAAAQIEAQRQLPDHVREPTLGWVYLTDHYAAHAEALLAALQARWPGVAWVGAVGVGASAVCTLTFTPTGGSAVTATFVALGIA